ncbi:SH3 domain-containing protein [Novosphingopyxis sp.]|uniref:SH3 domain-containing protein n=1 Tax=Novosphingopyxis sp. TaxID=2709690 RepID=UPI003B59C5D2
MSGEDGKNFRNFFGCAALSLVVFLVFAISQCNKATSVHDPNLPPAGGAALSYANGDTVYVTATHLNVRDEPNLHGRIIDSLTFGSKLRILDRSGEWIGFEKRHKRSWVSAKYVSDNQSLADQSSALGLTQAAKTPTETRSRPAASRRSFFAKKCKRGKPCGNACISRDRVCHK